MTTDGLDSTSATLAIAVISGYPSLWTTGSGTTGPISDNKSNTWNYLTVQQSDWADIKCQLAYSYLTTGKGAGHTVSTSVGVSSLAVSFFSGTASASVVDGQNGAKNNAINSLSTGIVTRGTTAQLVYTAWCAAGTDNAGQTVTGFTVLSQIVGTNIAQSQSSAYVIDSGSTVTSATWAQTNNLQEAVVIASFKHN